MALVQVRLFLRFSRFTIRSFGIPFSPFCQRIISIYFRETIDLVGMILSKTDFSISRMYDEGEKSWRGQLFLVSSYLMSGPVLSVALVDKAGMGLGEQVRDKLVDTRQAVLDITRSTDVGGAHQALMRASSTVRHPYVDPINVVQAELLRRIRALDVRSDLSKEELEEKELLKDALIVSITGIAQGMRNSG